MNQIVTAMIATVDQEDVIAFLSRGDVYGQPGAAVERIETHASVVFLVGDRVYKLKRALRYSYLDYSTAEKREAMCRAELLLNRRTAPQLYLGIRAVTRERGGALALDGAGEPVDWLVEMARFSQDMLFDRLAAQHKLTPLVMRDLADTIAAFHDGADRCEVTTYSAAMRNIADGNIRNLRLSGAMLDPDKIATLASATDAALARASSLLDKRGGDGHVRRCHGDLHLRNICLIEGKPVLFDGIEFNEEFIRIDKLYDLAFLLMDLDHRGLDDFASILFNRYLDRVGDDTGLAVLPLYLSIRAAVRAHVSMAAVGQSRTEQGKPALVAEASQYLDLALALLAPARPCLVAVGGFSGSGKSTVAQALAPRFRPFPGARILRSDVLRKRLAGVPPETRLPGAAYDRAANECVYRGLYKEAAEAVKAGYTAVADAAFLDEAERDTIGAVAAEAGVRFFGFWLEAPAARLRDRVGVRTGDASDADRAVLEKQLARDVGVIHWCKLDAGGTVASVAATALIEINAALANTR